MREFPTFPSYEPAHLACVPRALLPLLCGQLAELEQREAWSSDEDWRQGYQWIVEFQADLMSGCIDKLIEGQERIYRLLDTSLNGTVYTVTPAENPVPAPPADPTKPTISPRIPTAPASTAPQLLTNIALRNRVDRLVDIVDNALNGTPIVPPASSSRPNVRENLEQIRLLLEAANTDDASIEDILNLILLALG